MNADLDVQEIQDQATLPAIYQLSGKELEGGWIVGELLKSPQDQDDGYSSGGTFSVCYSCSISGKNAFLKVFDVFRALQSANALQELQNVTTAFRHESFIVGICKNAGMSRVVQGLASVETKIAEPLMAGMNIPFCYVIFEMADQGDLRKMLHRTSGVDLAFKFHILHEVAVGLSQLHKNRIAHQDLKPSNVGVFQSDAARAKILDLGRATSLDFGAFHDALPCPGDGSYAPPEQLYGYTTDSFVDRRASGDLFQLGSLLCFLLFWQTAIQEMLRRVPEEFRPQNWSGKYGDVLPYIQEAFAEWLNEVEPHIPDWCRKDVMDLLCHACDPDPLRRGDPKARMQKPTSIGMDRFVSRLANLSRRAEVMVRVAGAQRS